MKPTQTALKAEVCVTATQLQAWLWLSRLSLFICEMEWIMTLTHLPDVLPGFREIVHAKAAL